MKLQVPSTLLTKTTSEAQAVKTAASATSAFEQLLAAAETAPPGAPTTEPRRQPTVAPSGDAKTVTVPEVAVASADAPLAEGTSSGQPPQVSVTHEEVTPWAPSAAPTAGWPDVKFALATFASHSPAATQAVPPPRVEAPKPRGEQTPSVQRASPSPQGTAGPPSHGLVAQLVDDDLRASKPSSAAQQPQAWHRPPGRTTALPTPANGPRPAEFKQGDVEAGSSAALGQVAESEQASVAAPLELSAPRAPLTFEQESAAQPRSFAPPATTLDRPPALAMATPMREPLVEASAEPATAVLAMAATPMREPLVQANAEPATAVAVLQQPDVAQVAPLTSSAEHQEAAVPALPDAEATTPTVRVVRPHFGPTSIKKPMAKVAWAQVDEGEAPNDSGEAKPLQLVPRTSTLVGAVDEDTIRAAHFAPVLEVASAPAVGSSSAFSAMSSSRVDALRELASAGPPVLRPLAEAPAAVVTALVLPRLEQNIDTEREDLKGEPKLSSVSHAGPRAERQVMTVEHLAALTPPVVASAPASPTPVALPAAPHPAAAKSEKPEKGTAAVDNVAPPRRATSASRGENSLETSGSDPANPKAADPVGAGVTAGVNHATRATAPELVNEPTKVNAALSALPPSLGEDPSLRVVMLPQVARVSVETADAGRLSIQVKVNDGVAEVRATGPAAPLAEARQGELRVALAKEGLAMGSFDMTQSQSGSQSHSQQRHEPERGVERFAPRPAPRTSPHTTPAQTSTPQGVHVKA